MREIVKDGCVLARHIVKEDLKEGLNFFSKDEELIQVGVWQYSRGKELLAHVHNVVPRTVPKTCEALYIIHGSLEASIYDLNRNLLETIIVNTGEILVLLGGGHGYRILEEGTQVLEIKNGPYLGADIDRTRIG